MNDEEDAEDFLERLCNEEVPDDNLYRLGAHKYAVATAVPPNAGSQQWFNLMRYTTRESKNIKLPFSL